MNVIREQETPLFKEMLDSQDILQTITGTKLPISQVW